MITKQCFPCQTLLFSSHHGNYLNQKQAWSFWDAGQKFLLIEFWWSLLFKMQNNFKHNLLTTANQILDKIFRVYMFLNQIVMRSVPHQPGTSLQVTEFMHANW